MTLTPDTESAFRHYLENDPKKTKCGVHKFTMEQFGLTKKDLKEEFKEYIDFMTGKGFPEEDVLWAMSHYIVDKTIYKCKMLLGIAQRFAACICMCIEHWKDE